MRFWNFSMRCIKHCTGIKTRKIMYIHPSTLLIYSAKPRCNWYIKHGLLFTRAIALFMVNFSNLHHNIILHVCEAISGYFLVLAWNCLAHTLDYIVMKIRKTNREKGYCSHFVHSPPHVQYWHHPSKLVHAFCQFSTKQRCRGGVCVDMSKAVTTSMVWRLCKRFNIQEAFLFCC